ncbi:hypothetical protein AQUSIP_24570 [Aquicella siphonis]|uniref:Uncharacterized protein n=1 Tax=Aquicella siphonis TaxID=254247 RepID=A0A5E4PJD1_9COXI|nr:hypothetical protein [Aquicella siphonis]VVC77130.1 hypothetical protein AQUSIP_24570 [Aquicella siphonis]
MSIQNKLRVINRVIDTVDEIKKKYAQNEAVSPDLSKLSQSLQNLKDYLSKLDQLQPNYTTNEIDRYVVAINLDLDLLKNELEKQDFIRLQKGARVIRTVLKFHPTKYSFIEYVLIWIYEFFYFI